MLVHAYVTLSGKAKWSEPHLIIKMLHFVLFHNVTCYTNSIVSGIYVNTTKIHNITWLWLPHVWYYGVCRELLKHCKNFKVHLALIVADRYAAKSYNNTKVLYMLNERGRLEQHKHPSINTTNVRKSYHAVMPLKIFVDTRFQTAMCPTPSFNHNDQLVASLIQWVFKSKYMTCMHHTLRYNSYVVYMSLMSHMFYFDFILVHLA